MPDLSIITATYNRADCLIQCWESLNNQTCKDFEWIIIDDGSTDHTYEVVAELKQKSRDMCIKYLYKENGGKHTALNHSHPYIHGKYILILDSDDYLTNDAVESVLVKWSEYERNTEVGQIIFLKGYSENESICYVQHENTVLDTLKEKRISNTGRDCCDTYRASLFKKYPFPVFVGEKFLGEGSAFLFIELESKGVYVNKVIYLCAYREDGLTKAGRKMRLENPQGGRFNSQAYMNSRLPIKIRFKKSVLYVCYSKFLFMKFKTILGDNPYKFLTLASYLPGVLLYRFWKMKYFSR